eukprot:15350006-Ditylum_brightwellii.AAC.1
MVYPLRKKFMELFERIQKNDPSFTIKETLGENLWSNPNKLPLGKEFKTTFKVRNSSNIWRTPRLALYCTFFSAKKVRDIKFEANLFSYLNGHKIFINYNYFETEEDGNPGFLIELYPKLTKKNNLASFMTKDSATVEFEDDPTKDNRKGEEILKELTTFVEKFCPNRDKGKTMIPKFKLQKGMKKYSNGIKRVEAPVIIIKSTLQDAPYLKTLFNYGYETGQMTFGTFVPSGIHLIVNVATYKGSLRKQNSYIDSVSAVMISWMSEGAVMQCITYKLKRTSLAKIFLEEQWCDFEKLECTEKTEDEGKWFFIYRKT